jgi:collagen type I/II/III/V/XI/XXIV/XXVII alpha
VAGVLAGVGRGCWLAAAVAVGVLAMTAVGTRLLGVGVGVGLVALVGVGVVWRTAVGTAGATVRAAPGVGVATLAAGGSGLDVSRLRGLAWVGVARGAAGAAGATGATTAGASGSCLGTAGGSAMTGALNGVDVATGVGGTGVGDGTRVLVAEGAAAAASSASGAGLTAIAAVGAAVGSGSAARAASSISARRSTIVLPRPSRYPPQASRKSMATMA